MGRKKGQTNRNMSGHDGEQEGAFTRSRTLAGQNDTGARREGRYDAGDGHGAKFTDDKRTEFSDRSATMLDEDEGREDEGQGGSESVLNDDGGVLGQGVAANFSDSASLVMGAMTGKKHLKSPMRGADAGLDMEVSAHGGMNSGEGSGRMESSKLSTQDLTESGKDTKKASEMDERTGQNTNRFAQGEVAGSGSVHVDGTAGYVLGADREVTKVGVDGERARDEDGDRQPFGAKPHVNTTASIGTSARPWKDLFTKDTGKFQGVNFEICESYY